MPSLLLVVVVTFAGAVAAACDNNPTAPSAAPVLDQQNPLDGSLGGQGFGRGIVDDIERDEENAQTFTVGITGRLTEIRAPIFNFEGETAPVELDVRRTVDGVPETTNAFVIASAVLPSSALLTMSVSEARGTPEAWPRFRFDNRNIRVTVGDTLAFTVRTTAPGRYIYNPESTLTYDAGRSFRRNLVFTNLWTEAAARDYGFQVYVTP